MSSDRDEVRERARQQLLASLGGWSGTIISALPTVVFVIVNAVSGLRPGVIAAVATAVVAAGYRLARRQSLQQAANGLIGVVVAAFIAARTGQARDYFVVGIITAFVYGAVFAVSLIVRRPLVGLAWEFLDPTPLPPGVRWYQVTSLRRAYDIASAAALAVFLARAIVQLSLFNHNATGWLAVARISMGYPLFIAVIGLSFWVVRRARHHLPPIDPGTDSPSA